MAFIAWVTCPACGKHGYGSKRTAKQDLRRSQLTGMSVYQCRSAGSELWHWGHLPGSVKDGRLTRDSLGYTAPRPRRERR